MYINVDTGELLTKEEAIEQWRDEYDGGDDTNGLEFSEQYIRA